MEHHPVASNSFLCVNLWVAGDSLAQYSEHRYDDQKSSHEFHFDYARTAKCAGYGAFVTGPILALWYPYMDRICTQYKLASRYGAWGAPIAKVLADEFIMDPPCLVAFYGYMNVCEGGTMKSFEHKLQTEFFNSWLTSLAVWPPILLGAFRFLPVYAQAPVINICCIAWDGFLSHRNTVARHSESRKAKEDS